MILVLSYLLISNWPVVWPKKIFFFMLSWTIFHKLKYSNHIFVRGTVSTRFFLLTSFVWWVLCFEQHCKWMVYDHMALQNLQSLSFFGDPDYISAQAFRHCPSRAGDLGLNMPWSECAIGQGTVARAISRNVRPSRTRRNDFLPRTPTTEEIITPSSSDSAPGAGTNTGSDGKQWRSCQILASFPRTSTLMSWFRKSPRWWGPTPYINR